MKGIERALIGAAGGLAAVCVKFLGQDYYNVVTQASNLTEEQWIAYLIGYSILTPILIFLGALLSWVSEEKTRLKALAIGVAAPAMITTWSGGNKPENFVVQLAPVGTAYAQERQLSQDREPSIGDRVSRGIGIFFGYGKDIKRYWVIVGSFEDERDAQEYAEKINAEAPELNAYVGIQGRNSRVWPVVVGGYVPLSEARELKARALRTNTIQDAFLSPGDN